MAKTPPDSDLEPPPDPHRDAEFYVVCRQPLPARDGGWNLELAGKVLVREIRDTDIPPSLRNAAGAVKIAQVVYLRSAYEWGRLTAQLAMELSSSTRGLVVDQAGWEARASHRTTAPRWTRAVEIERAINAIVKRETDVD